MNNVIKHIAITEKSTDLEAQRKYVFAVEARANKKQIRRAIEDEHNVEVVGVNTINLMRRAKRWRHSAGSKKRYKKAIVTLKEGDSITVQ